MKYDLLKFSIISIIILINLIFKSSAEIVKKIEVSGNERIPDSTIILFSNVEINDNIDLNDIDVILKKIYKSKFFKDVSVNLNENILKINVKENPIIQYINYNGIKSKKINDKILNLRILKPRFSYNQNILKKDENIISNILKNDGYYFSKIETNVEFLKDNKVNINYDVSLGKKSKIKKISFIGDKIFKDRKLKNIIISEEYKFWKFISGKKYLNKEIIDFDNRLLKNFYLNKGYHDVKINSSFARLIDDNQFELIFNINSNQKFFFNDIELELLVDFDEKNFLNVFEYFDDLKGKPYSIYQIKKIIDLIEEISLSEQYESIKVEPVENIISNKIDIKFTITETEKFYVEKINLFGNNITQENVIRNQLKLDEGDPYNEILFNKSISNLKGLNFFKDTKAEVIEGSNQDFKIINISVVEKPTGEMSLGAGTGTSGGTIGFSVNENNFLGKGINFNLSTSVTEETLKGQFYVKNPNFQNSDKSIYFGIDSIEVDRSSEFGYKSNKSGFTLGTDFEYLDDLNLGIGLSNFYEKITTDKSASTLQKTQEGNYWDSFLKLNFNYDKRNQTFQASDGFKSYYSIDLPLVSDTSTLVNYYKYDIYNELFENNVSKASFLIKTANSISGENIKLSERLFIPSKEYSQRPEIKERARNLIRERLKNDPIFILKSRLRTRFYQYIKRGLAKKKVNTSKLIGCDWLYLKNHLEKTI